MVVVSSQANDGVTFAHELGHYLGMEDVYDSFKLDGRRSYVEGRACYSYQSGDWNNGCVCHDGIPWAERYYGGGTLQGNIIKRLLMNGNLDDSSGKEGEGRDITGGMIYGYDRYGSLGDVDTGFFKDWTFQGRN